MTTNQVVHLHYLANGHFETDNPNIATSNTLLHLLGRECKRSGEFLTHRVVVGKGLTLGLHLCTECVQLLGSVESVVSITRLNKLHSIFEINLLALALAIGGVGTTLIYTLVDGDTAPTERVENITLGSLDKAIGVSVLNSKNKITTSTTCKEVVVKGGTNSTHMKWPGGAWRKAHSHSSFHIFIHLVSISLLCYTLNRKCIMSPSCTTYSLPSMPILPASRQAFSLPRVV